MYSQRANSFTNALFRMGKNLIDLLGPDKRFRVLVINFDEIVYCGDEVGNAVKNPSTDTLSGEFRKQTIARPGSAMRNWSE